MELPTPQSSMTSRHVKGIVSLPNERSSRPSMQLALAAAFVSLRFHIMSWPVWQRIATYLEQVPIADGDVHNKDECPPRLHTWARSRFNAKETGISNVTVAMSLIAGLAAWGTSTSCLPRLVVTTRTFRGPKDAPCPPRGIAHLYVTRTDMKPSSSNHWLVARDSQPLGY